MRHGGKEDRANITLASDLVGKKVDVLWRGDRALMGRMLLAVDMRARMFKIEGSQVDGVQRPGLWHPLDLIEAICDASEAGGG
jgi:hypothetical protein